MRNLNRGQRAQEAQRLMLSGDPAQAATILDELAGELPRNGVILSLLARSQLLLGQLETALANARRAIKAEPKLPEAHCQLGDIVRAGEHLDAARTAYETALRLEPDHPWALKGIAECFFLTGDNDEARRVLLPAFERHPDKPGISLAFARVCQRLGRAEQSAESLTRWLENDSVDRATRREGFFILGGLCDKLAQYDRAFDAYERGNALRTGSFDPARRSKEIDSRINAINNPLSPDALPRSTVESELPVLIVGMPRSGTSLVEQIIDAHCDTHGCGELKDLARIEGDLKAELSATLDPRPLVNIADDAAKNYIKALTALAGGARRATDKNPFNFERLGMVDRLLPGARIVHCVRNPVDTCLSCYFSNFPGDTAFTNDQSHCSQYFKQYRRLMDHWKETIEVRILDVSYEALTGDPEGETRRLIEFLGLSWDDACLRHHESGRITHTSSAGQADQPIYRSSVERWRRYEHRLGPMLEELKDC